MLANAKAKVPIRLFACVLVLGYLSCCGDDRSVPAEQRLSFVRFSSEDRASIAADQFASLRAAVLLVRQLETERPLFESPTPLEQEQIVVFNDELADASLAAVMIIRQVGWTEEERRLMHRALRSASKEDLSGETNPG